MKTVLIKGRKYIITISGPATYLTAPGNSEPTYKIVRGRLSWYKKRFIRSNYWQEVYSSDDFEDDFMSYMIAYLVFSDILGDDYDSMAADDYVDENDMVAQIPEHEPYDHVRDAANEETLPDSHEVEESSGSSEEAAQEAAEETYSAPEPEPTRHEAPESSYSSSDDSGGYDSGDSGSDD